MQARASGKDTLKKAISTRCNDLFFKDSSLIKLLWLCQQYERNCPGPLSFIYPKAKADDVLVNALHKVVLDEWALAAPAPKPD